MHIYCSFVSVLIECPNFVTHRVELIRILLANNQQLSLFATSLLYIQANADTTLASIYSKDVAICNRHSGGDICTHLLYFYKTFECNYNTGKCYIIVPIKTGYDKTGYSNVLVEILPLLRRTHRLR